MNPVTCSSADQTSIKMKLFSNEVVNDLQTKMLVYESRISEIEAIINTIEKNVIDESINLKESNIDLQEKFDKLISCNYDTHN